MNKLNNVKIGLVSVADSQSSESSGSDSGGEESDDTHVKMEEWAVFNPKIVKNKKKQPGRLAAKANN